MSSVIYMPDVDTIESSDLDSRILEGKQKELAVARMLASQKSDTIRKSNSRQLGQLSDSSNFDNRLANAPKNDEGDKSVDAENGAEEQGKELGQEISLRQKIAKARKQAELKTKGESLISGAISSPARKGTGILLKQAWLNLLTSFGLTLIYINLHVFLKWIFPNQFCKLGDEWRAKIVSGKNIPGNIGGTGFGIVEVIGLLILDLIAIFIIISILTFFVMIVDFMTAGWGEKIFTLLKGITGLSWQGVKAIVELF